MVTGLGGGGIGSAAHGAAGAGVAAWAAGDLNRLANGTRDALGGGDAAQLAGNVAANILAGGIGALIGNLAGNIASGLAGAAVGSTAGAATASNVNLYNAANDKNDTEAKKEAQELKQALDKERAALGQGAAKVPSGAQAATVQSTALAAGAAAGKVAPQNDVNLASPDRTTHILTGDATGGGHQWPGGPGKSVFPQDWSSSKIMSAVSDIATDPSVPETVQANGRIVKNGSVDGIAIRVVIEPASKGGGIVTAFPTNVPRSPK